MTFTVAIVGRPNVGKSTLFNRLVGRRDAIVHDTPGVTRDRREGGATLFDLSFRIFDTAGLEEAPPDAMESRMRAQTERAVANADVALLLIDARAGLTPLDRHFAQALRKGRTPVIVVANKCEGRAGQPGLLEAYELGLGDPVALSAEHGEGLGELYDALRPFGREPEIEDQDGDETAGDAEPQLAEEVVRTLHMAVVGRPNVGKSTIVNRLLGEDRMLTGPEAGLTRDAIAIPWEWNGRPVRLVDTAGLRRRATISDSLEKLSVADTLESIRMANVVVLVLDSQAILDKQDLTIARMVVEEGRALAIAINKWDLVDDKATALARLSDRLEASLPQVRGVPTVTMSALAGRGLDKLMAAVEKVYETWNRRIPTSQLNRWLEEMTERHPPPALQGGRRLRLRYMTQAKARPPTFVAFVSKADELPESYVRYLVNGLRQTFGLDGVPIRFNLRKRKNPYAE